MTQMVKVFISILLLVYSLMMHSQECSSIYTYGGDVVRYGINSFNVLGGSVTNISRYGADPDNADNYLEIQNAINSSSSTIIFGYKGETYTISRPLNLISNKDYVINCEIKLMDGLTSALSEDIASGDTTILVDEISKFSVGQWIAVTDTNQLEYYQTDRGWAGKIERISGDTLELDNACPLTITVAHEGRVSHCSPILLAENISNITIRGNGTIDGNKSNQDQIHPVYTVGEDENQRSGCGIAIWESEYIVIKDITVKDCLLHNISISGSDFSNGCNTINLLSLTVIGGHDKNILVRFTDSVVVNDCAVTGALWEDGLIFYNFVTNATVNNLYASENKRAGLNWNSSDNSGLVATNIIGVNNTFRTLYITGPDAVFNNVSCTGDGILLAEPTGSYDCSNIIINTISILNANQSQMVYFLGGIDNITINDLTIDGCTGIGFKSEDYSGDTNYPSNVTINRIGISNHTGLTTDISIGSDITFNDFTGL